MEKIKAILNSPMFYAFVGLVIGSIVSNSCQEKVEVVTGNEAALDSLKLRADRIAVSLLHAKRAVASKESQVIRLKDSLSAEKKSRKAAEKKLVRIRDTYYSETQVDSIFLANYPSYAVKDSLMKMPLSAGRQVANDVVELESAYGVIESMNREIDDSDAIIEAQDSLNASMKKRTALDEENFRNSILQMGASNAVWKDNFESEHDKLKRIRNQRNWSVVGNVVLLVLSVLK